MSSRENFTDDEFKKLHCSRTVPFDQYERNDLADREWWQKQFDYLEKDYGVVSFSNIKHISSNDVFEL